MTSPLRRLLVCGIGNPGKAYAFTRHSIGILAVDGIQKTWRFPEFEKLGDYGQVSQGHDASLFKSTVFMNCSGKAVSKAQNKFSDHCLIVLHDELELAPGLVKLRKSGQPRGHNGLRSIISTIGNEFYRIGIGIGRPESRDSQNVSDYVLNGLSSAEVRILHEDAVPSILDIIDGLKQEL